MSKSNSRRRFLMGGAATSLTGLMHGCGGGGDSNVIADSSVASSKGEPQSSPLSATNNGMGPSMGAMFLQDVIYSCFRSQNDFNPYAVLAASGVQWARTLIQTTINPELDSVPAAQWGRTFGWKNSYWSSREMGAEVLRRATASGMKLQLGLFLSDEAADAGAQKRPAAWSGLNDAQLAAKVGEYARETATYYKRAGLNVEVFEVGNECDFGLCGYQLGGTVPIPPGVDPLNTPSWMSENLWSKFIPLFKAAITGLREVYPSARIALHLAAFGYRRHKDLPKTFFEAMVKAGVAYDIAGFSYPYISTGSSAVPQPYYLDLDFLGALDAVRALGKEVQILEFTYPAATAGIDTSLAHLPCTEAGQAEFISQFSKAVAGRVDRINYWAADVFPNINGVGGLPANIESFGLFASATTPRLSVAAIRRAAADRLFDWAQARYPNLFPSQVVSATYEQFYYRFYAQSGMYLALDQNSAAVVLHNGKEWNFSSVGNVADLIRVAG